MQPARVAQAIQAAARAGWLCPSPAAGDDGRALLVHDLDLLDRHLDLLRASLPDGALHAVAVKANPVAAILDHLAARGFGLEAASAAELRLALERLPPERVLYDAPARTLDELRRAAQAGVHLHLDRLQELERLEAVLGGRPPGGPVGLRINPAVGPGRVEATSTAMAGGKFGADLSAEREAILEAFARRPWLSWLHAHVGSAGMAVEQIAEAAGRLQALAEEIAARGGRVVGLDIGGGVPVPDEGEEPAFVALAEALRARAPGLFDGRFRLATELGRSLHQAAGVALSRVEVVRRSGGRNLAVVHLGADLFLRAVYQPAAFRHRISVHRPDGEPVSGPKAPWDVHGPLCFAGDRLAKGLLLPPIREGDVLAIHDAGAYTLAMWSRFNSRPAPGLMGLRGLEGRLLQRPEREEEVLAFWRRGAAEA